jgi:transcriptional regulator NrdR family protein
MVGEVQAVRRRRECEKCGTRETTYELVLDRKVVGEMRKARKVAELKNKITAIQVGAA